MSPVAIGEGGAKHGGRRPNVQTQFSPKLSVLRKRSFYVFHVFLTIESSGLPSSREFQLRHRTSAKIRVRSRLVAFLEQFQRRLHHVPVFPGDV